VIGNPDCAVITLESAQPPMRLPVQPWYALPN
jgi:hypothetical protein